MVVVGLVFGCAAPMRIEARKADHLSIDVPNTPEGLACQRECLLVFHACHGGSALNIDACRPEQLRCLRTCPGAKEDGVLVEHDDATRY